MGQLNDSILKVENCFYVLPSGNIQHDDLANNEE